MLLVASIQATPVPKWEWVYYYSCPRPHTACPNAVGLGLKDCAGFITMQWGVKTNYYELVDTGKECS
jgi:hypothetical protein